MIKKVCKSILVVFFYGIDVFLLAPLYYSCVLLLVSRRRAQRVFYGIFWVLGCGALWLVFRRPRIYGRQNIPPKGSYLVVARHRSWWDVFAIALALGIKRQLHIIMKSPLKFWALSRLATLVDEKHYRPAKIANVYRFLKRGGILCIFPEGAITPEKRKPEKGVVRIAAKTNSPILPVRIKGKGMFGYGQGNAWRYLCGKARLEIDIGKALAVSELGPVRAKAQQEAALKKLMERIDEVKRGEE